MQGELRDCQTCARKPGELNHPPGMVFIGWGRGWETCPACKGSQRVVVEGEGQRAPLVRLAVRSDGGLVLGKNIRNLLKPGMVYEITEVLGELAVREVGESVATYRDREHAAGRTDRALSSYASWGRDPSTLVIDGDHLLTVSEVRERTVRYYVDGIVQSKFDLSSAPKELEDEIRTRVRAMTAPPKEA